MKSVLSWIFRKQAYQSIINPDWDFNKMGIGGLDREFSAIFRRAFASRVFPPDVVEQLGEKLMIKFFPTIYKECLLVFHCRA